MRICVRSNDTRPFRIRRQPKLIYIGDNANGIFNDVREDMLNTVGEISPFRRINRNYHSTMDELVTHEPATTVGHGPQCGPHEFVRMQVVDGQKVPWAAIGAEREHARWATCWPPHTGIRLNPLKSFLNRPRQYDLITNTTPTHTPPQGAKRAPDMAPFKVNAHSFHFSKVLFQ